MKLRSLNISAGSVRTKTRNRHESVSFASTFPAKAENCFYVNAWGVWGDIVDERRKQKKSEESKKNERENLSI